MSDADSLRDDLAATHDALDRLLSLVWREQPDLDAVRRAADVLRVNHAVSGLPMTASFVLPAGPKPRLCLAPDPEDNSEGVVCVLGAGHEGHHGYPALGLYW